MKKTDFSKIFVILIVINVVCLLTSNIITSKPVTFLSFVFTAGDFLFPISYIINDAIVEIYGYEKAKFSIIISFLANLLMVVFLMIAVLLPYPNYYLNQVAFSTILSSTPRLLLASMLAYYFGNVFNSLVMDKLKKKKNNQKLWHRTILSSIFGEAVDSVVFLTIAFIGTIDFTNLVIMIFSVYLLKLSVEILFTPVLIKIINKLKEMEGL